MSEELLLIALVSGLCSVDGTAAFQVMLSRPLAVGTITGAVLGEPGAGFGLGCLLELLWMGDLPVGSVVPPDTCVSTVVAVGAGVLAKRLHPGASWESLQGLMLLASLPVAWVGGVADIWQRRSHAGLAERAEAALERGREGALAKAVAASVAITFLRGALLALAFTALLAPAASWLLAHLPHPARVGLEWSYWLGLLLGFMVAVDQFWERRFLNLALLSFFFTALAVYALKLSPSSVLAMACATAGILGLHHESQSRRALKEAP